MHKMLMFSLLSLVFTSTGSQTLLAQGVEVYRAKWNQRLPADEQYTILKQMDQDGLLPKTPVGKEKVSLRDLFSKSEKACQLPKDKEEHKAYFKNPPKVCTEALKQAYKETFKQLIMNKS